MTWLKKKPEAKKDVIKEISNIEKRFEVFRIGIALLISMLLIILIFLQKRTISDYYLKMNEFKFRGKMGLYMKLMSYLRGLANNFMWLYDLLS